MNKIKELFLVNYENSKLIKFRIYYYISSYLNIFLYKIFFFNVYYICRDFQKYMYVYILIVDLKDLFFKFFVFLVFCDK